jgi:hypothetical protein
VDGAIKTRVSVLAGSLQQNAQHPEHATKIESAADNHAPSGLLGGNQGGAIGDILGGLLGAKK